MLKHQKGQGIIEYGLIAALVAIVAIPSLMFLQGSLQSCFLGMLGSSSAQGAVAAPASSSSYSLSLLNSQLTASAPSVSSSGGASPTVSTTATSQGMGTKIQVSGANGTQVYNNSQALFALAKQLSVSNPAVANLLVQLGNKGLTVAQSISATDGLMNGNVAVATNQSSVQNATSLLPNTQDYTTLWSQVQNSAEYKALSPADQALVSSLANNTVTVSNNVMMSGGSSGASTTVANDSTAIKSCGQNGTCNK